jgi:hypothetical protein
MESSYASAWPVSQLIKVHKHAFTRRSSHGSFGALCQQFQMLVVNRATILAHQDMSVPTLYANDMAGQCAAFCKLSLGRPISLGLTFFTAEEMP